MSQSYFSSSETSRTLIVSLPTGFLFAFELALLYFQRDAVLLRYLFAEFLQLSADFFTGVHDGL